MQPKIHYRVRPTIDLHLIKTNPVNILTLFHLCTLSLKIPPSSVSSEIKKEVSNGSYVMLHRCPTTGLADSRLLLFRTCHPLQEKRTNDGETKRKNYYSIIRHTTFWLESKKRKDHPEDLGIDVCMVLKHILRKEIF
jgi:hypothetical protein